MKLPVTLNGYTAQELCDCGAVRYSAVDQPIFLKRLQKHRLDSVMQENLKMQTLIIEANKGMTGEPWMRNQNKLGKLFVEFDELQIVANQICEINPPNVKDHRGAGNKSH